MSCASASSSLACRPFASAPRLYQLGNYTKASLHLGRSGNSLFLPRRPLSVAFARRKSTGTSSKKRIIQKNDRKDDGLDEDAFEALFNQLEEDLKNDNLSDDDWDDELTEEDLVRLEQELEEALGSEDEDELSGILHSLDGNVEANVFVEEEDDDKEEEEQKQKQEQEEEDDDDDDEEEPLKLKTWQLRRLASALKIGRRKTSIKNLAAELGLDRAVVLELLRDPPPNLLLLSASLPEVIENHIKQEKDYALKAPVELVEAPEAEDLAEPMSEVNAPIHVTVNRWSTQKRLKKVQIETLERVYLRSKRPTNSMINSIVHVTNLPRKTVIKWFEEKRLQDGGPNRRLPYSRSVAEVVPQTSNQFN